MSLLWVEIPSVKGIEAGVEGVGGKINRQEDSYFTDKILTLLINLGGGFTFPGRKLNLSFFSYEMLLWSLHRNLSSAPHGLFCLQIS